MLIRRTHRKPNAFNSHVIPLLENLVTEQLTLRMEGPDGEPDSGPEGEIGGGMDGWKVGKYWISHA